MNLCKVSKSKTSQNSLPTHYQKMRKKMKKEIQEVNKFGIKARGQAAILKYLQGKPITKRQAIEAKCYECMGYYIHGAIDCSVRECPLYPYNPYRKKS